jgi:hypothetical protein
MADPAVAALGSGFVSDTARVNGATLHYVRGGAGPAIILLHGFPEDWYAYHRIMSQLAKQFTVVAVDVGPWDAVKANPITWHINFQQTPGLPEQLLAGREAIYLRDSRREPDETTDS